MDVSICTKGLFVSLVFGLTQANKNLDFFQLKAIYKGSSFLFAILSNQIFFTSGIANHKRLLLKAFIII